MIGKLVLVRWSDLFYGIAYRRNEDCYSVLVAPSESPFLDNKCVTAIRVHPRDMTVISEHDPIYELKYAGILSELSILAKEPLQQEHQIALETLKEVQGIIRRFHEMMVNLKNHRNAIEGGLENLDKLESDIEKIVSGDGDDKDKED